MVNQVKTSAHKIGALYFVVVIMGIVGEFLLPNFIVSGDAAATAEKAATGIATYRFNIFSSVVSGVVFLILTHSLYHFFRDIDRRQATLMLLLVSFGILIAFANNLIEMAPLVLLGGSEYSSAFAKPQLDALVMFFLRLTGSGSAIAILFWGLWLFPFGWLVIRSKWFPRALGYMLYAAGLAYVVTSVVAILTPDLRQAAITWLMPLYLGELPIVFWMLIKGARVQVAQQS